MNVTLLTAAASMLGAVALATAPAATAAPEDAFLDAIAAEGIVWEPADTPAVIDTGHAVCTDWTNGATFAQELNDLISVTDWTPEQAGVFVGAATGAFCPQFMDRLG